jgi:hypothetical protein
VRARVSGVGDQRPAPAPICLDTVPSADATTVRKLYEAGAVLTRKLATHEFAHGGPSFDLPWPPARNPWKREHFTGGSSSGSGAAVAAGSVQADIEEHRRIREFVAREIKPEFVQLIEGGHFVPTYAQIVSMTPQEVLKKSQQQYVASTRISSRRAISQAELKAIGMSVDLNPSKRTVLNFAADLASGLTSGRELVEAALAQIPIPPAKARAPLSRSTATMPAPRPMRRTGCAKPGTSSRPLPDYRFR